MRNVIMRPCHILAWHKAGMGKPVDWDFIFKHYNATVDFPASLFYGELKRKYPSAKVILTIRDPEAWYQSTERTIYKVPTIIPYWFKRMVFPLRKFIEMTELLVWNGLDVDVPENIYFPHLNTGDTMVRILNAVRILTYIVVIIIMISIITLLIYPK